MLTLKIRQKINKAAGRPELIGKDILFICINFFFRFQPWLLGSSSGELAWSWATELPGQEGDQGPGDAEHQGDTGDTF